MPHAIRIHEPGGPEALRLDEVEVGEPGPGEVRLRQTAVGVNFLDVYHRNGLYPLPHLPHGIGTEAAGVVEAVGPDVSDLAVGDRVAYGGSRPGGYAEARLMPAERLVKLPPDVGDTQAVALMQRGMTVEYLVRRTFRVEAGMTVLLHAAAGGVGLIASQWLAWLGATVIGTVGSDEKAALARAHGCRHTLVYTREDWVARVRELTDGRGVPVVYDGVGAATFAGSLACLARRGMLVSFGNASGAVRQLDPLELMRRGSLYLTRPSLMDYVASREELVDSATTVFDMVRRGAVRVTIGHTWPLDQAREAHRALEARETTGSVLLLP